MQVIVEESEQHQSEMQEIISAPPHWLIQWGMMLLFLILVMLFGLSALIRYPDIVKTRLKLNSEISPKPVVTKVSGKLIRILVKENEQVSLGQALAYLESTGNHDNILKVLAQLKSAQYRILKNEALSKSLLSAEMFQLGELQGSYQIFYQSYLSYKASALDGIYLKTKSYLQNDLLSIASQRRSLESQKKLQEREYELAKQEYEMHKKLFEQRVEAQMELKREEGKFLSSHYPLQQTESALLENSNRYSTKEKEMMELDNQINEEKFKFLQALNSLVSEIEEWKSKYVLSAAEAGKLIYSGIIQEKQYIEANQEVFYTDPGVGGFFGEMTIPQYNMGKIKEGQEVLVKLESYPYEEYGILRGNINTIGQVPFRDSVYISKVSFKKSGMTDLRGDVKFKNGMIADAEIITEEASLLKRLTKNLIKIVR